jgi:uncharacterized protein YecE (DUF72 family)
MARAWIGTSGWMYDEWRDSFYAGVPRARWLSHCAEQFDVVEINASHYRLQRRSTFERWAAAVPDDFRFTLKAHRYLTHVRRLRDPTEPIRRDRDAAQALGHRLAVVLWQLPARFAHDHERESRLARFLDALAAGWPVRHAIELRHRSWFSPQVAKLLERHGISVVISHAADWPMWEDLTTDLVYVRLHGHPRTYASEYGRSGLRPWAGRIERWLAGGRDVYVFFDNDMEGAAPRDAALLKAMLDGR